MSYHFVFSYSKPIDHQDLLKEIKKFFIKFSPEHIAIGTLDGQTHVYIEVNLAYQIQGKNPLKYVWEATVPTLGEKNVRNYRKFKSLFESRNLMGEVTHFYANECQSSLQQRELFMANEELSELRPLKEKLEDLTWKYQKFEAERKVATDDGLESSENNPVRNNQDSGQPKKKKKRKKRVLQVPPPTDADLLLLKDDEHENQQQHNSIIQFLQDQQSKFNAFSSELGLFLSHMSDHPDPKRLKQLSNALIGRPIIDLHSEKYKDFFEIWEIKLDEWNSNEYNKALQTPSTNMQLLRRPPTTRASRTSIDKTISDEKKRPHEKHTYATAAKKIYTKTNSNSRAPSIITSPVHEK